MREILVKSPIFLIKKLFLIFRLANYILFGMVFSACFMYYIVNWAVQFSTPNIAGFVGFIFISFFLLMKFKSHIYNYRISFSVGASVGASILLLSTYPIIDMASKIGLQLSVMLNGEKNIEYVAQNLYSKFPGFSRENVNKYMDSAWANASNEEKDDYAIDYVVFLLTKNKTTLNDIALASEIFHEKINTQKGLKEKTKSLVMLLLEASQLDYHFFAIRNVNKHKDGGDILLLFSHLLEQQNDFVSDGVLRKELSKLCSLEYPLALRYCQMFTSELGVDFSLSFNIDDKLALIESKERELNKHSFVSYIVSHQGYVLEQIIIRMMLEWAD